MQNHFRATQSRSPAAPSDQPQETTTARTRVLVVDDDPRNLLAINEVLEDIAELVLAKSGEEALRFLLREEFAVILLDVLMPGLDGYETAKLVRQREQSKRTPIIFLTAINKEDAHLLRGYDSGAVDYVFKPFEPTILRSKVSVFVSLFEKTREIQQKAVVEQKLLEDNLKANAEMLRMEQALRQSEQRQAVIFASLPLAVYVEQSFDDRAPQFMAGDLKSLTGFSVEDFESNPALWASRLHPEDKSVALRPMGAPGDQRVNEYRWAHADGSYRYFLDHAVPLQDGTAAMAGTLRDVTDRRHLQDQLLQSQKLDAIGKLSGGIAHDFNNLLASILSGLSLLERRVEMTPEARRIADMTRHAAKQGAELIGRMLAFSRRQQLRPETVRLQDLGDTMTGLVHPILGGLIRLEWEADEQLWPAYVDAGQLELAIVNLVLNARDAMPNGGTITIRMDNRMLKTSADDLAAGDYVVVTVRDTGSGIAAEDLAKVIEPFFTTKEVGKGTGLGLSTAYGFAKQSSGTLRISSTLGRGTEVEIWLPRSAEVPRDSTFAAPGKPERTVSHGDSPTVVLLVDDSASLRDLTSLQLADSGFEVVCASGGAEALALIEREPDRFDIIVTDFAMPLISGLDVVRFARSLKADWPAIIVTGYADAAEIRDRPDDVPLLSKPFAHADLLEQIDLLVAPRRAFRAASE